MVSTERDIRRVVGLMRCFRDMPEEADWRKPKNATKDWKARTAWREYDLVDPSHMEGKGKEVRVEEAEKGLQTERERRALQLKAKVDQLTPVVDPRDAAN